jgi:hypothetical protein
MSGSRTGVGSGIDIGRLSLALARPGIDTRVWCSIAIANDDQFFDEKHGLFVDLTLLPSGDIITARVGTSYAGTNWGTYDGKVLKDDEVCVLFPNGDPAEGGIIVARLWSAADVPPSAAKDHQDDYVVAVQPEKNFRAVTTGAGKAVLDSEHVFLGKDDATEQLVLGTTYRSKESALMNDLNTAALLLSQAGAMMAAPITGAVLAGPIITSAGSTIASAVSTFEGGASGYLSGVSRTK